MSVLSAKIQSYCTGVSLRRYQKKVRSKIRNRNFTILCPNCIGGIIYHNLGMEFLSPTINLWMIQPDYLKFISNLPAYLAEDLIFLPNEASYPVAMLGDIKIHFNHYKDEQQAKTSWDKRKSRIRLDNLYLIMYDRDGLTQEDLVRFGEIPCKNRIILSDREHPDIPYVKTMTPNNRVNGPQFLDKDWFGRRTFEKKWDYVTWLNTEEG